MKYILIILVFISSHSFACRGSYADFEKSMEKAHVEYLNNLKELRKNSDLIFIAKLFDFRKEEQDAGFTIFPVFSEVDILKGDNTNTHVLNFFKSNLISIDCSMSYDLRGDELYAGAKYLVYVKNGIIQRFKLFIEYPIELTAKEELKALVQ
ncbi:hypothetical protein [Paraglaciecola mesophila]|nr:hypothetical protein [Paraglaciecola mesophila]